MNKSRHDYEPILHIRKCDPRSILSKMPLSDLGAKSIEFGDLQLIAPAV
jgi:hypothetical protein